MQNHLKKILLVALIHLVALGAQQVFAAGGSGNDEMDHQLGPWLDLKGGGVALGSPQGKPPGPYGILENASILPERGPGFRRGSDAASSAGTGFMISLIENAAAAMNQWDPKITVIVGDIAKTMGGYFYPPHNSHQNGLDADILFMGAKGYDSVVDHDGHVTDRFDKEKNWQFWRFITAQKFVQKGKVESIVSMILVAPEIKLALCAWAKDNHHLESPEDRFVMRSLRPTEGHQDHFHIRLRCSPYHEQCTGTYAPPAETGCEGL